VSAWYLTFLAGLAVASAAVMVNCDFRDRAGMVGYLVLIGLIDAFNRIGAVEYVAAGMLHFIFGATMIYVSTRAVGSVVGVLSFLIAILCGLAYLGFIPTERGAGIAFNIYHYGMVMQWGQVFVFASLGLWGAFDRDLA